jgi:hypothetical protein
MCKDWWWIWLKGGRERIQYNAVQCNASSWKKVWHFQAESRIAMCGDEAGQESRQDCICRQAMLELNWRLDSGGSCRKKGVQHSSQHWIECLTGALASRFRFLHRSASKAHACILAAEGFLTVLLESIATATAASPSSPSCIPLSLRFQAHAC